MELQPMSGAKGKPVLRAHPPPISSNHSVNQALVTTTSNGRRSRSSSSSSSSDEEKRVSSRPSLPKPRSMVKISTTILPVTADNECKSQVAFFIELFQLLAGFSCSCAPQYELEAAERALAEVHRPGETWTKPSRIVLIQQSGLT